MGEVMKRFKAESPSFFKKVQKVAISLGVSAAGVWAANEMLNLGLHEPVLNVCKYVIAAAAAAGGVAKLTVKDPKELE